MFYGAFHDLPISSLRVNGWLRRYLQLQKEGLTGHLEKAGYPFDSVSWENGDVSSAEGTDNPGWWAYEQTAYWLDGLERVGQLLNDEVLLCKADRSLNAVLTQADADGYLGPSFLKTTDGWCRWPHVVFFRALMAKHSATGDPSIVKAVADHYLNNSCEYSRSRDVLNVEIMLWAYEHTGDERLLAFAEKTFLDYNNNTFDDNTVAAHNSNRKPYAHGVTYNEFAKLGAILYMYTGHEAYLQPSLKAYRKLQRYFMLVDGLHCSNEFLLDDDYMRSHETCDVSDYTWSLGYLLRATGDGKYADGIERCVFNAGFGSVDERFRALQYFSCPNQLVLDRHSNHNDFFKGHAWMSYRPNPDTECCPGNVNRFFPNYCARMWMQTENGIAAVLYGDSELTYRTVLIRQETDYPFEDTVRFTVSTAQPLRFVFSLRIPSWCSAPQLLLNGEPVMLTVEKGFVHLDREFCDGDTLKLTLPSEVLVRAWKTTGVYVEKGPLLYTYGMYGDRRIDTEDSKSSDQFPAYNIYPDKPWNYALKAGETRLELVRNHEMTHEPWHIDRVPLAVRIPARRLRGWTLTHRRNIQYVDNLYQRPWNRIKKTGDFVFTPRHPSRRFIQKHGAQEEEWITLVPYGCAKVRLTVFPALPQELY